MKSEIKQFDRVLLKDGRTGDIMEVYGKQEEFDVTIGKGPEDWETIIIAIDKIEKKIDS